jgi:hypothetical protein
VYNYLCKPPNSFVTGRANGDYITDIRAFIQREKWSIWRTVLMEGEYGFLSRNTTVDSGRLKLNRVMWTQTADVFGPMLGIGQDHKECRILA